MRVHVGHVDDIPPGERAFFDVDGEEIAVLNIDGEYRAVRNFCPHMEGPLGRGTVTVFEDEEGCPEPHISCPFHGWEFNLNTGRLVKQDRVTVRTYEVSVEDGDLYVQS